MGIHKNDTDSVVTIREYTSIAQAYEDRNILVDNGIEAYVNGEYMASVYPGLPQFAPVTIIVRKEDELRAMELLKIEL